MKIKIEIKDDDSNTLLNCESFEDAIIKLIDEREWHNFYNKDKMRRLLKKVIKRRKK